MNDVSLERQGPVAVITLDRPERRNALDTDTVAELSSHLSDFDQNPDYRAAVIRGAGPVFCAGARRDADTSDQPGSAQPVRNPGLADLVIDLQQDKPVVAAVHGYAIGGGVRVLLHCDFVVAARSTRFRLPEILLGLDVGPLWELIRESGTRGFADDVCLTGRYWTAEEADHAGIVHNVVDDDDVFNAALAAATEFAALPGNALGELIRSKRRIIRRIESGAANQQGTRREDSPAITNGGN